MRILFTTYWKIPGIGGVATFMDSMTAELRRRGHEVDIFGQKRLEDAAHFIGGRGFPYSPFVPVIESACRDAGFEFPEEETRPYEKSRYCLELALAGIQLDRYDVIHANDVFSASAVARVRPQSVPLIALIHGCLTTGWELVPPDNDTPRFRAYVKAMERKGIVAPDITTVQSKWLKTVYESIFPDIGGRCLHVSHYGIDATEMFRAMQGPTSDLPCRLPSPQEEKRKVILFAGRLEGIKDPMLLIKSGLILKSIRDDWVLWIAGNGCLENAMRDETRRVGLENHILFAGPRTDLPAILARSDIVALPSVQDNHPYIVMEAQMAGKPVVASVAAGIPELVDHARTGLLFPIGNEHAMAAQLAVLLADDKQRSSLGKAAKEEALERWDMSRAADRFLQICNMALEMGPRNSVRMKRLTVGGADLTLPESYEIPDPDIAAISSK